MQDPDVRASVDESKPSPFRFQVNVYNEWCGQRVRVHRETLPDLSFVQGKLLPLMCHMLCEEHNARFVEVLCL